MPWQAETEHRRVAKKGRFRKRGFQRLNFSSFLTRRKGGLDCRKPLKANGFMKPQRSKSNSPEILSELSGVPKSRIPLGYGTGTKGVPKLPFIPCPASASNRSLDTTSDHASAKPT